MDENDTPQFRPYPQHPPKSLDDLSAKLIDNGLSGVSQGLLERRIEQLGYLSQVLRPRRIPHYGELPDIPDRWPHVDGKIPLPHGQVPSDSEV